MQPEFSPRILANLRESFFLFRVDPRDSRVKK